MSRKYKFKDRDELYFVTFAVVYWIYLFIREEYTGSTNRIVFHEKNVRNHFIYIAVIWLFLLGCSPSQKITSCNQQCATLIADKKISRNGYKLGTLKRNLEEFKDYYLFHYYPIDTLTLGNAAVIKIKKENCEIIDMQFFQ